MRILWLLSSQLQQVGGDGPTACCVHCGAKAVGPCASCHAPLCGDCCVLTEGGAKTWAICGRCEKSGGRSLAAGWWQVAAWVAAPILLLALVLLVLKLL